MRITLLDTVNIASIYNAFELTELEVKFPTNEDEGNEIVQLTVPSPEAAIAIENLLNPFASNEINEFGEYIAPVLVDTEGYKIICIEDDEGNTYRIKHEYNQHEVKSWISNSCGTQLNKDGDPSTFINIVDMLFGIKQEYLEYTRLSRVMIDVVNAPRDERINIISKYTTCERSQNMFSNLCRRHRELTIALDYSKTLYRDLTNSRFALSRFTEGIIERWMNMVAAQTRDIIGIISYRDLTSPEIFPYFYALLYLEHSMRMNKALTIGTGKDTRVIEPRWLYDGKLNDGKYYSSYINDDKAFDVSELTPECRVQVATLLSIAVATTTGLMHSHLTLNLMNKEIREAGNFTNNLSTTQEWGEYDQTILTVPIGNHLNCLHSSLIRIDRNGVTYDGETCMDGMRYY